MPVYASTQGFADQGRHPRALMFIVGGHAVLVAAVMTAKTEVIPLVGPTKTVVELIKEVKPPPPLPPELVPPRPEYPVQPRDSQIDLQKPIVPIPTEDPVEFAATLPQLPSLGPIGSGTESIANPTPKLDPVRVAARFATPDSLLRPPYPDDKARLEEEGTLRLRLSIDERFRDEDDALRSVLRSDLDSVTTRLSLNLAADSDRASQEVDVIHTQRCCLP